MNVIPVVLPPPGAMTLKGATLATGRCDGPHDDGIVLLRKESESFPRSMTCPHVEPPVGRWVG